MRISASNFRRSSAFTLAELLVVVAIIGVLIGMLTPEIRRVTEAARRVSCASNLRQVGMACLAYAENWKGRFPVQNPNPNFWSRTSWGQGLYGALEYVGGNGTVMYCAGARSPRNSIFTWHNSAVLGGDWAHIGQFGYNYYAGCVEVGTTWWDSPFSSNSPMELGGLGAMKANNKSLFSTSRILSTSGRAPVSSGILAGDAIYIFGAGTNWQTTAINHSAGGPLRVGGGGNYVHGDGHVEWYAFPTDIINGGNGWCTYLPWKLDYVIQ